MRRNSWNFILAVFSKFPLELIYSFYFILFLFYYLFFFIWYCIPPGGTSPILITGRLRAELQPFYVQQRYQFRIRSIDNWYPFHIPSHTPRCTPFNCKCAVF